MQKNYNVNHPVAAPGLMYGIGNPRVAPFINSTAVNLQQVSLTLASPVASTDYWVEIEGARALYTTDATPTSTELLDGLFGAMRSNPEFLSKVSTKIVAGKIVLTAPDLLTLIAPNLSTGITSAVTQIASAMPTQVPFGRFVARDNTYPKMCAQLPMNNTQKIMGVAMSNMGVEKMGIAEFAKPGYPPFSTMNIVDRTNDCVGIWVECIEPDFKADDNLYVSVAATNEGKATKSATGTISLITVSRVMRDAVQLDGKNLICVSLNLL